MPKVGGMNRYPESRQQSAELLRLTLAQMGQHDAAFNPITFAVWYEHVAGTNPRLSEALQRSRESDSKLGDDTVLRLYRQHVSDIDDATAERVSEDFRRVMQSLSESAARTGDSATDFGVKLVQLNRSLGAGDSSAVAAQVDDALAGTLHMRGAVDALQAQVATSRNEIEQLRDDLRRTREDAIRCPLTRVLNRKGFDQRLQALLDQAASGRTGCLVMLDIDHFKKVNDEHGHLTGDRVLEALGEILRRATAMPGATAARYGGEEFAILLSDSSLGAAVDLAERVCSSLKKVRIRQRSTDQIVLTITASAGVAAALPNDDASALVSRADAALYRAKQAGRDRVVTA